MALKSVFAPHLGRNVKFGRLQPTSFVPRRHTLSSFFNESLPAPPSSTNYRSKADGILRDIYGNDTLGDCVVAAGYHAEGEAGANAGDGFHAMLKQIVGDYTAIGGYVPGDESTDNGCDEETALRYWCTHGFANGVKLMGFIPLDPTNWLEIRQAIYLFEGGVFYGVGLPDAWISPFPSGDGFVWDDTGSDANPQNGHAYLGVDYNEKGVIVDSWGLEGICTPRATAKYASNAQGGQLFALLTPSLIAKGMLKAPNGLDWAALIAAFNQMGGNVAPPTPAPPAPPPPTPTPVPASTMTLAEAITCTGDAFHKGPRALFRDAAAKIAKDALTKHWH